MDTQTDIIIAGGGPAGVMAAVRVARAKPNLSITIVEKDGSPGGRIKASNHSTHWTYGLSSISPALFDFWDGILKADPEGVDLPHFATGRQNRVGVLAANSMSEVNVSELCETPGFKAIAGPAAGRDGVKWTQFCASIDAGEGKSDTFQHIFKSDRQAPAVVALSHILRIGGITELMSANALAVAVRARRLMEGRFYGRWEEALVATLKTVERQVNFEVNCRIFKAAHEKGLWTLSTEQGVISAPTLIVAQAPWDAMTWLPKDRCPSTLATLVSHVQPTSILSMTMTTDEVLDLPDIVIVPAEEVQIIRISPREVCFQATLAFEMTFEAPAVVKAVRRLKRARKKLELFAKDGQFLNEHLALLPAAWTPTVSQSDHRYIERLRKGDFQAKDLMFCGDSYGADFDGDQNLIHSVLQVEAQTASLLPSRPLNLPLHEPSQPTTVGQERD